MVIVRPNYIFELHISKFTPAVLLLLFRPPSGLSVVLLDIYPGESAKSSIRVFSKPELSPQCLEGIFL